MLTRVKDLHGIARLEVERNEELQRLVHPRLREPNRDLRDPFDKGFQAEKPPFALINQRGAQTPKLHHEPLRLGPNRERPVRGMLVSSHDFFDWNIERGLPDIRRRCRHLLEPALPVQRLEPEKAIVGAVGNRHQSLGREIAVHQDNQPLSRLRKKAHMHHESVDGAVVGHQGMAAVALVDPAQGVRAVPYLGLVRLRHLRGRAM